MNGPFDQIRVVLKKEARSFYLSLIIFPGAVKKQISIAYLFCKIADTIVDSELFKKEDRREILFNYYNVLTSDLPVEVFIRDLPFKKKEPSGDKRLMLSIGPGLSVFRRFSPEDQKRILTVSGEVIKGMEMDLKGKTMDDEPALDRYCYYVAGSAGAFLTELFFQHRLIKEDWEKMITLGIAFGKGLQLTNILRDRFEDSQRGRFYLPKAGNRASARTTLDHALCGLQKGLDYVVRVPKSSWRIRAAAFWPLIFALKTLERLNLDRESGFTAPNKIKISRFQIYSTMIFTSIILFFNRWTRSYFESIKNRIHPTFGSVGPKTGISDGERR
jgi:farnesyl-diphosphate farnesyltransferase